jgi:integrase
VVPEWQGRNIEEIEKEDISTLLFKIAKQGIKGANGKRAGTRFVATSVFAQVSKLFSWYEVNYSNRGYRSPIVRGMLAKKDIPTPRKRVLSYDEIRVLWGACDTEPVYGPLIKIALLTAQRFYTVAKMRRSDIRATN